MPHIIGKIGESFESVEVGRETLKTFTILAVKNESRYRASRSDFTDKVFRKIVDKKLPLNEKTIKEYISNL